MPLTVIMRGNELFSSCCFPQSRNNIAPLLTVGFAFYVVFIVVAITELSILPELSAFVKY